MTAEDALKEREEGESVISAKCGNKTYVGIIVAFRGNATSDCHAAPPARVC